MKFFFTSDNTLVGFEIGPTVVVLRDCYQGQHLTAMLAAFSPMFPDNATAIYAAEMSNAVASALAPYPKTKEILLGENGRGVLLTHRKCGRSMLLRTKDRRCTAVRVLDPE